MCVCACMCVCIAGMLVFVFFGGGESKGDFSKATTRCKGGHDFFPWIVLFYP